MNVTLSWTVFETGVADLYRAPVLISGQHEAILVDGGFTLSTGRRLAEEITKSGKRLEALVVTCHDPDYYFSLGPVTAAFPGTAVLAPPAIAAKIAETAAHKIDVWRSQLGEDGPQSIADLVLPRALSEGRLTLEGQTIEIVAAKQALNFHLWLPAERAILGGVQISGANHVWMADTPTPEDRAPWIASLEDMIALNPAAAPPGHMPPGSPVGIAAIKATRDYIRAFDEEQPKASDSVSLIAAMKRRYPGLGMDFILELGARVCKGEQVWP